MGAAVHKKIAQFLKLLHETRATQELEGNISINKTFLIRFVSYDPIDIFKEIHEILQASRFFMYVNSIDSKKKNNLLAIVWFDHPGRKIFLESVHRQRVRVFEFLNPFEYTLPILISNFNILFYYELECVGEFPNKYVRFSFEFGEYYDHVSFPELDLDKFEHLYYMRDRDRRNPRRRK